MSKLAQNTIDKMWIKCHHKGDLGAKNWIEFRLVLVYNIDFVWKNLDFDVDQMPSKGWFRCENLVVWQLVSKHPRIRDRVMVGTTVNMEIYEKGFQDWKVLLV